MTAIETVIWFCGFYEGEGCVSNDKSNNNKIKLSISQNDRSPLDLGRSIWGGNIRERTRVSSKNKIIILSRLILSSKYVQECIEKKKLNNFFEKIFFLLRDISGLLEVGGWLGVGAICVRDRALISRVI